MDFRIDKLARLLCLCQFVTSFDSCTLKQHKITVLNSANCIQLQLLSTSPNARQRHSSANQSMLHVHHYQRVGDEPSPKHPFHSPPGCQLPHLICSCSWNSVVAKAANRAVGKKTMISGCSGRVGPKNKPKQLTAPEHLVRRWLLLDLLVQYVPAQDYSMKLGWFSRGRFDDHDPNIS